MHRTIVANAQQSPKLGQLFWEAGPKRTQEAFESFLRDEVAAGKLDIADTHRAATQFFCLLKGELHARLEFGCGEAADAARNRRAPQRDRRFVPARLRAALERRSLSSSTPVTVSNNT